MARTSSTGLVALTLAIAHGPIQRRPVGKAPADDGEAIASYGRIFKSLHILAYIDDEAYRRDIKGIRNLQEGRHSLAATIFHGKKGELYQRYHNGMEDQLGALGLVLNCVVLTSILGRLAFRSDSWR